jgi:hypothetical protein
VAVAVVLAAAAAVIRAAADSEVLAEEISVAAEQAAIGSSLFKTGIWKTYFAIAIERFEISFIQK